MHQGGSEAGRLGDYVLNQQGKHRSLTKQEAKQISRVALDQIMTALMENSNAHRPVPATEQTIGGLDHEVLEEGCAWFVCLADLALLTHVPSPPS
jgi:E3 ubiquitin-protein ligase RNF115/126